MRKILVSLVVAAFAFSVTAVQATACECKPEGHKKIHRQRVKIRTKAIGPVDALGCDELSYKSNGMNRLKGCGELH